MVKRHIENHDLLANQHGDTDPDPKATSDTSSMEDTDEFRVMMAYAQRRRRKDESKSQAQDDPSALSGNGDANGTTPSQVKPEEGLTEKKKKKKKKSLKLLKFFKCVNPQTEAKELQQYSLGKVEEEEETPDDHYRCFDPKTLTEGKEEEKLGEVASRLTEIADEIPFAPPQWETDSSEGDENIEKMIALLLRESGDKLNEKELKDANIAMELFWDYSFFKSLLHRLLSKMGLRSPDPESPGPQASPKTQIAVTCEVTSRLSTINTLPTSRLFNHGAKYLQEYYSPWVQEQGGYEAAFESDEDEVE
ncbi:uncharacterized protein LOC114431543 isoform X2 [Parambassis ranga]|uniref:Uncharacterized protein LOC114431543 isoform X2 n=1 Tax=Parambassis ranga TaxID=210632 RepID=A0A6P7HLY3_9TELE|nr:apoptosis facilitator Bcl-2-like protein 14 isoform X2 [Parambassis ranga]